MQKFFDLSRQNRTLGLVLWSFVAFNLQSMPLNATPPEVLEFKRVDRSQFETFVQSCKTSSFRRHNVNIMEIYYHHLYQIKNQCIKGMRIKVCKTFAVNVADGQCSEEFYIADFGHYKDNSNYAVPDKIKDEQEVQPPLVIDGKDGSALLFSTPRLIILETVE